MAIEPIKGFYVHDEATNTDGVAKYDAEQLAGDVPEVVGIRTGYDGTVYSSAGDAVRAQAEQIEKNITPLNNTINLYDGATIYGGWSTTQASNVANITADATEQKRIAYIPCKPNTQYWIVRDVASGGVGRIGTTEVKPTIGTAVTEIADIYNGLNRSITTGENAKYLLFYYTYQGLDTFVQFTDYETTTLNQTTLPVLPDVLYTKKQVDALVDASITPVKKCKVSKTGNVLNVYMPSPKSDKYIRFAYTHYVNASTNFDNWKVMGINVCNSDLNVLFNLYAGTANNTEWEGVVREKNTADFIGGYHGDETNTMLSVIVDGVPLDMSQDYAPFECSDVLIVNKSFVNRCDTPNDNLFTRYKVSHWTPEKYTIRNRWIALQDNIALDRVYMTMLSLPIQIGNYTIATNGRYDDGYIVQSPTGDAVQGSCLYNSKYAKQVEFWGNNFYARGKAIYDNYNDYICYCDRSQSNIFKGYWRQYAIPDNGSYTFNINDEINGFSEYEFIF